MVKSILAALISVFFFGCATMAPVSERGQTEKRDPVKRELCSRTRLSGIPSITLGLRNSIREGRIKATLPVSGESGKIEIEFMGSIDKCKKRCCGNRNAVYKIIGESGEFFLMLPEDGNAAVITDNLGDENVVPPREPGFKKEIVIKKAIDDLGYECRYKNMQGDEKVTWIKLNSDRTVSISNELKSLGYIVTVPVDVVLIPLFFISYFSCMGCL